MKIQRTCQPVLSALVSEFLEEVAELSFDTCYVLDDSSAEMLLSRLHSLPISDSQRLRENLLVIGEVEDTEMPSRYVYHIIGNDSGQMHAQIIAQWPDTLEGELSAACFTEQLQAALSFQLVG